MDRPIICLGCHGQIFNADSTCIRCRRSSLRHLNATKEQAKLFRQAEWEGLSATIRQGLTAKLSSADKGNWRSIVRRLNQVLGLHFHIKAKAKRSPVKIAE